MKICKCCDLEKSEDEFPKGRNQCKVCYSALSKIRAKKYYQENKDKLNLYSKKYQENNYESIKYKSIEYYHSNKEKLLNDKKKYYQENKEKLLNDKKEYYKSNKDKIKEYNQSYYFDNRQSIIKNNIEYRKNKVDVDPLFRLQVNIRSLIYTSFKRKSMLKSNKTEQILGCTISEFKFYLESKFEEWMTWENYGLYNGNERYGWDIDHIVPISSAQNEEDMIKLNHFTNLQPLCSLTNRYIKRNEYKGHK